MTDLPDIASAGDLSKLKSRDADAIVRQVGTAVRRYCHWHVAPVVEQTQRLTATDDTVLFLPTMQLVELIEVTNAGQPLDLGDVDYDHEAGYLELHRGTWSRRPGKITVRMSHGYALDDAGSNDTTGEVADLVGIISQIALRAIDSPAGRTREHAGQVDIGFGLTGTGVSGGIALLEHEKALLDPYRVSLQ